MVQKGAESWCPTEPAAPNEGLVFHSQDWLTDVNWLKGGLSSSFGEGVLYVSRPYESGEALDISSFWCLCF